MDRKIFYDCIRDDLFNGVLRQQHVDGMEAILNFWDAPPKPPQGDFKTNWHIRSIGWLAYMLATTKHETASTMQPIDEYGDAAYFTQMYENRSDLGNTAPGDGARFHRRGFVQLTGRANYTAMTGVVRSIFPDAPDFTEHPDAVKDDRYAAVIMFDGMFCGVFTGWALKNFIGDPLQGQIVDYFHARKIINGMDRADLIEGYAKKFATALDKAGATA